MVSYIAATAAGKVRGAEIADGLVGWRGIPYAAAPVGDLRLRLPQPVEPWSGVRDATRYESPSLQADLGLDSLSAPASTPPLPEPSEDCLYLNVTAPAGAADRPVLVWVHGGGYQIGDGTQLAGDGASFARTHGVVVVTFNYRLGALGFLAVAGEEHSGAFGLHDQIAALRWVRDNIAAFGGDPARVTVYGVSAGAKSVANLMASPPATGLFQQAASSSGGADHVATPAQAAALSARFFRELGTDAGRVREVAAAEIVAAQNAVGSGVRATWLWRPAIDGLALTTRPLDAIAAGAAKGVPLLAQVCVNECFLYQLAVPDAADQADRVLEEYFGPAARDEILAAYATLTADPRQLRIDVMTDERYAVPTRRLADAQSAHAPVWSSRYDGPLPGMPSGPLPAFHGTDALAIWSDTGRLHEAWGTFITTGTPRPDWPRHSPSLRPTMLFSTTGAQLAHGPDETRHAAWDGRDWQSGTWWSFS